MASERSLVERLPYRMSHRVSESCDCQPCQDTKSLARELAAAQAALAQWEARFASIEAEAAAAREALNFADDVTIEVMLRHSVVQSKRRREQQAEIAQWEARWRQAVELVNELAQVPTRPYGPDERKIYCDHCEATWLADTRVLHPDNECVIGKAERLVQAEMQRLAGEQR